MHLSPANTSTSNRCTSSTTQRQTCRCARTSRWCYCASCWGAARPPGTTPRSCCSPRRTPRSPRSRATCPWTERAPAAGERAERRRRERVSGGGEEEKRRRGGEEEEKRRRGGEEEKRRRGGEEGKRREGEKERRMLWHLLRLSEVLKIVYHWAGWCGQRLHPDKRFYIIDIVYYQDKRHSIAPFNFKDWCHDGEFHNTMEF